MARIASSNRIGKYEPELAYTVPVAEADFSYPNGLGQYQQGTIVNGTDNNLYRYEIPDWCISQISLYYAPGTGLAWDSAWSSL